MLSDPPARAARQPKLRASCDQCGASKLKCDRGQPKCGRCASYGAPCVYGVSRKMGKPPRERRQNSLPTTTTTSASTGVSEPPPRAAAESANVLGADEPAKGGMMIDLGPFPGNRSDGSAPWDAANDSPDNGPSFEMSLDALGGLRSDLFLGQPLATLTPPNLPEWVISEMAHDDLLSSGLGNGPFYAAAGSSGSTTNGPSNTSGQTDETRRPGDDGPISARPTVGHDCALEARRILESVSFFHPHDQQPHSQSRPSPSPGMGTAATAASGTAPRSVPLDHLLRVNREASENLSCLLKCSCPRSPSLVLLHASIIAQIMLCYKHAADASRLDPDSDSASSARGSSVESNAWSTSTVVTTLAHTHAAGRARSTDKSGTAKAVSGGSSMTVTHPQPAHSLTPPTEMTIGTFNVDDLDVQTALKMQLLFGEMRRAARLIDQFASCREGAGQSGQSDGGPSYGGLDGLYPGLEQWLRGEHLEIRNGMRAKLRELNAQLQ